MSDQAQLLPGTLDLLILKAVSLGPLHGYGILLRIAQISGQALLVEQGALYPALFRLVRQGLLKASWGTSDNNRRAKFYELTAQGRARLREETEGWNRLANAIASVLSAQPGEASASARACARSARGSSTARPPTRTSTRSCARTSSSARTTSSAPGSRAPKPSGARASSSAASSASKKRCATRWA